MIRTNIIYIKELNMKAYRRKIPTGGVSLEVIDKNGKTFCYIIASKKQKKAFSSPVIDVVSQSNILSLATSKTNSLKYYILPAVSAIDKMTRQKNTFTTPPLKKSIVNQFDKFIIEFTDKNGLFSQQQLNLKLIQFACRSKIISSMIRSKNYTADQIIKFILKTRAEEIAKVLIPSDEYVDALIHILDEVCNGVALQLLKNSILSRIELQK